MFVFSLSLGVRMGVIGIWRFEDSSKGEKWEEEGNFRGRRGEAGVGTLGRGRAPFMRAWGVRLERERDAVSLFLSLEDLDLD